MSLFVIQRSVVIVYRTYSYLGSLCVLTKFINSSAVATFRFFSDLKSKAGIYVATSMSITKGLFLA